METNKVPYETPELNVIKIQVDGIFMSSPLPGGNEQPGDIELV